VPLNLPLISTYYSKKYLKYYTSSYEPGNRNHPLGTGISGLKRIISTGKKSDFVVYRMSYIHTTKRLLTEYYYSECACSNLR